MSENSISSLPETTSKPNVNELVAIAVGHGVRNAVICPGSRNAPIAMALAACREISTEVIIDERSAAFVALGMAQTSQSPVMIVCTSGTALLNFSPAVAEAYYAGIPLIVVSADRPVQWIDQDDSQTLRQFQALENYVKKSFNIPDYSPDNQELTWYANREINDALLTALSGRKGPVHINIQLSQPLSATQPATPLIPRLISLVAGSNELPTATIKELAKEAADKKIMLIAGFMLPDSKINRAVASLSSLPNVFVFAETIANIHASNVCTGIDRVLSTLSEADKERMLPDLVITIGGALVSRMIKEYFRKFNNVEHWSLGQHLTTSDPLMCLTKRIEADTAHTLHRIATGIRYHNPVCDYANQWREIAGNALMSHNKFLDQCGWCDLKATATLFNALPKGCNLHCSNGTSIRYAQLNPAGCHASFCNRGVSGIDGCTSTAAGGARSYPGTTILLTGDMSFNYDMGILSWRGLPDTFKIAVLNNNGGDIFRFIPSTRDMPVREEFLCAAPGINLNQAADSFGIRYFHAASETELIKVIPQWLAHKGCAILDIETPTERNANTLIAYMNRNSMTSNT